MERAVEGQVEGSPLLDAGEELRARNVPDLESDVDLVIPDREEAADGHAGLHRGCQGKRFRLPHQR